MLLDSLEMALGCGGGNGATVLARGVGEWGFGGCGVLKWFTFAVVAGTTVFATSIAEVTGCAWRQVVSL